MEAVKEALAKGANILACKRSSRYRNCLAIVLQKKNRPRTDKVLPIIQLLLTHEKSKELLLATNAEQQTALHLAAVFGEPKIVQTLLEAGANAHAVCLKGSKPNDNVLSFSARYAHLAVVECLLEKVKDFDAAEKRLAIRRSKGTIPESSEIAARARKLELRRKIHELLKKETPKEQSRNEINSRTIAELRPRIADKIAAVRNMGRPLGQQATRAPVSVPAVPQSSAAEDDPLKEVKDTMVSLARNGGDLEVIKAYLVLVKGHDVRLKMMREAAWHGSVTVALKSY